MSREGSGTRGTTRASFAGATPQSYRLAQGNPAAIAQLTVIADRTSQTKERARLHFAKYQETWVVKEAIALWKRRAGLAADVTSLPSLAKEYTAQSMMTDARRIVRARMTQRLSKINSVGTRMSNAVVRNLQVMRQENGPSLKAGEGSPKKGSPSR